MLKSIGNRSTMTSLTVIPKWEVIYLNLDISEWNFVKKDEKRHSHPYSDGHFPVRFGPDIK